MAKYRPVFHENPLWMGAKPDKKLKSKGIIFTFKTAYRTKSDAQEAAKFYRSINNHTRIIKKKEGYWVYAGK